MSDDKTPICKECSDGGLYFHGPINSIGPRLFFLYKCETCGRGKWLDKKPEGVTIDDEFLRGINEN